MKMQKALFLDRDGVINIEKEYLYKIEDFEFMNGIFELCKHYQSLDYIIVVVTNQSGIARDYYTQENFDTLTTWMISEFLKNDTIVSKVYSCPHHPDISGKCSCRKPEPGMLLEAQKEFNIDMIKSIIIGDKERDIEAGLNAGLTKSYLYDESEKIKSSKATKIVSKLKDIYSADS